jgi:predicted HTH domain antitoxin
MTDAEIIAMFDSTNITLARLALISGRSVAQLKKLLMGG